MAARELVLSRTRDVAVFASPVRQEIFAAIGLHGPCTVTTLAAQLGRATTSLYHHLAQLVRVGAVAVTRRRRDDGKSEQVYAAAVGRVALGDSTGAGAVQARQRATAAFLRLTARELAAALADPSLRRKSPGREVYGMRAKAWLGSTQLRELDRLVQSIEALLSGARTRRPSTRPFALAVVLAPTDRPRGRRKSS